MQQAVALLMFNGEVGDDGTGNAENCEEISFPRMCALMNVKAEIGKRVMHSLSCGKYRVLTKVRDL